LFDFFELQTFCLTSFCCCIPLPISLLTIPWTNIPHSNQPTPPKKHQDVPDALGAAESLATTCELMLDECPSPDALGDELHGLTERLQQAVARVEAAAAAAQAAEE